MSWWRSGMSLGGVATSHSLQRRTTVCTISRLTTRTLRVGAATAAVALLLSSAPSAWAKPDPGDPLPISGTQPKVASTDCDLTRVGTQLMRCDYLTGAGVSAPLWIPEQGRHSGPPGRASMCDRD